MGMIQTSSVVLDLRGLVYFFVLPQLLPHLINIHVAVWSSLTGVICIGPATL